MGSFPSPLSYAFFQCKSLVCFPFLTLGLSLYYPPREFPSVCFLSPGGTYSMDDSFGLRRFPPKPSRHFLFGFCFQLHLPCTRSLRPTTTSNHICFYSRSLPRHKSSVSQHLRRTLLRCSTVPFSFISVLTFFSFFLTFAPDKRE